MYWDCVEYNQKICCVINMDTVETRGFTGSFLMNICSVETK